MNDESTQNDALAVATSSSEREVQNDEEVEKLTAKKKRKSYPLHKAKPIVHFTPEEIQSIWTFLLDEIRSKEPGREGRIRRAEVDPARTELWMRYNEKYHGIRNIQILMHYYRYNCKKIFELPFLSMADMLDLCFGLEIPIVKYLQPRFVERFGVVFENLGIVKSAADVTHWDHERFVGVDEEHVPFSAEEDRQLWAFINRKIRDETGEVRKLGPMGQLTNDQIWKDYLVETRTERTRGCVFKHLQKDLLANIMSADLEMQMKIEILYGLNRRIDMTTLKIIRNHAEIELNSQGMICFAANNKFCVGQKEQLERQPQPTRRLLEYRAQFEEKMKTLRNASSGVSRVPAQTNSSRNLLETKKDPVPRALVPRPHVNLPPRVPTPYMKPQRPANRMKFGNFGIGRVAKKRPIDEVEGPSTSTASPLEPWSQLLEKVGLVKQEIPETMIKQEIPETMIKQEIPETMIKQEIPETMIKEELVDPEWPSEQPLLPRNRVDPAEVAMANVNELFNGIWDTLPTFYAKVQEAASNMTAEEKQPYVTRAENIARMLRLNGKYAFAPKRKD